jgi:hypothetical protein
LSYQMWFSSTIIFSLFVMLVFHIFDLFIFRGVIR